MSRNGVDRTQARFGEKPIPTLAEVLLILEQRTDLTPRQRTDLCSAVRGVGRALGLPLESTPARLDQLRRQLARVRPTAHGFSKSRWTTVRSQFTTALRLAGFELLPGRSLAKLTEDWARLHEQLPSKMLRHSLSRLLHYCSAQGLAPEKVDDAVFERFQVALLESSLVKQPEKIVQRSKVCWNQAVDAVPGWPQHELDIPSRRNWYALPLAAFPASFAADVEAWLDRLGGSDLTEDLPFRPVVPSSLAKRRRELRQLASALVHQGREPASITSLRDLVALDAARQALEYVMARTGGKPTSQLASLSALLLGIARHWVGVDAKHEAKLKNLARRCRPRRGGMAAKNRAMLRQFEDPDTVLRLLTLPAQLVKGLEKEPRLSVHWARQVEMAVAIELLLVAPIRLGNLTNLNLDRHLIRVGAGAAARLHLWVPADEVKNNMDLEFPLPAETMELIELYLTKARPVLEPRPECRTLFVGRAGGPRNQTALGTALTRLVERAVGVRVSPHQFRHLAGFLYLRQNPGSLEDVRALLGHHDLATTARFYAGMEGIAAARAYDAAVLRQRRDPA
jgi:integrase